MSKIINHRYVLAVTRLQRSLQYYNDVLGFQTSFNEDGWAFVKRDNCLVMLGECPDSPEARDLTNHNYFAYIQVDNAQLLYDEFASKNAVLLTEVSVKPWGMKEFALETIDGHRIMFGEEINPE